MLIASISRHGKARDGQRCMAEGALARFRDDEDGSLVIFSLMLLVAMIFTAGLAVDFMRFESTRAQLQHTMDRAVLAAASLEQKQNPEAVVRDYFEKAGLGDYIGDINIEEETSSGTASYRRVKVVAGASMDPIFLPIMEEIVRPRRWAVREGHGEDASDLLANEVDFSKMPIFAVSSAEEGVSDLEISLVVDVSGSMDWDSASGNSKIHELREAAKDFVYHMQCNPNEDRSSGADCEVPAGKVSISLVPYAEQVNLGPQLIEGFNVTDEHNSSFCVNFEEDDFSGVSMGQFVKPDVMAGSPHPSTVLDRTGHFDPWNEKDEAPSNWTCHNENWRWIKPLVEDYTDLYSAIDALEAKGSTSIDMGMKWGAALVDPGIREVVNELTDTPVATGSSTMVIDPVFEGRPYNYGQDRNIKAVIVMTDGQNTNQHYLLDQYRSGLSEVWHYDAADPLEVEMPIFSVYKPANGKYAWVDEQGNLVDNQWHDDVYIGEPEEECEEVTVTYYTWWGAPRTRQEIQCTVTAAATGTPKQLTYQDVWAKLPTDWYASFNWLSDPVTYNEGTAKNTRLQSICDAAKDKDILVYTIGFEVPENSTAETVMQNCATTVNHFFRADGLNLSDVFTAIASSINQLRLTE